MENKLRLQITEKYRRNVFINVVIPLYKATPACASDKSILLLSLAKKYCL